MNRRDHHPVVVSKKAGDQTIHTASCRCGWKAEPHNAITAALTDWDQHLEREKKA